MNHSRSPIAIVILFPRTLVAGAIRAYQCALSPDHSWVKHFFPHGYCRFHPSCSEYSRQAVLRHGVTGGTILGAARVLRCNPWSRGGEDPVPSISDVSARARTRGVRLPLSPHA